MAFMNEANISKEVKKQSVKLCNPHLLEMKEDELYHLALNSKQHDLKKMFGHVKFVVMGGSQWRMKKYAEFFVQELGIEVPPGMTLDNISKQSDRYVMYLVGPILLVSHGIGCPSMSIVLHEVIKMLSYADSTKLTFFRMGTCGGIAITPGTVIITTEALNGLEKPVLELDILGKRIERAAVLDQELVEELLECGESSDPFKIIKAKTICCNDFYEGQGRLDGAICEYERQEKIKYLKHLQEIGVRNIEMECVVFAAMCHKVGVKAAVVCVSLVDRMEEDQVSSPQICHTWDNRPAIIMSRYIKKELQKSA